MDWIREWILQIIGVVVIGAVCDAIMVEGEMKKYVKPILGFVLILTVIRPVTALSNDKLRLDIFWESAANSAEFSYDMDEVQKTHIVYMYEERLGASVFEKIKSRYGFEADVTVLADKEAERIGAIDRIDASIKVTELQIVNTESIKRYIADEFGIDDKNVTVALKER